MKLHLLFSLFLSGCTLPYAVDHLSAPASETVRVQRGDTLRVTTQELVQAKKIKNRGTLIVQAGNDNVASQVERAKAPVAAGKDATATSTKTSRSFLDYAWILFAGAVVVLYLKYRR